MRREPVTRLFTSPLGRARATAAYAEEALGLKAEVEDWTRELAGLRIENRNLMAWDLHGGVIREAAAKHAAAADWENHSDFTSLPIRQTLDRIAASSDAFCARLGYHREDHHYRVMQRNEDTMAVFCHGGFGLSWIAHLLALPPPLVWAGFFLHTSSLTTILWDEREEGYAVPRALAVGATPHLALAGLEPSTSGIKANYW